MIDESEDKPNMRKDVTQDGNDARQCQIPRHVEIEKRNRELASGGGDPGYQSGSRLRDTKIGVITSGIPYQYVREALPEASVLKLGMVHPLPRADDPRISPPGWRRSISWRNWTRS